MGHLASAFLDVLPQFPCYSTYCANYAYVADALAHVRAATRPSVRVPSPIR